MPLGLIGGALPGETLGEGARARAERRDELAGLGDATHRDAHGLDVTVWNEESRFAVADRLANTRGIRRNDWRRTGSCFEIRNTPALLGRCKGERPRTAQQCPLVRFRDAPKKSHAVAEVKRAGERLERGT